MVIPLLAWLIGVAMFAALVGLVKFLIWLSDELGDGVILLLLGLTFSVMIAVCIAPAVRTALSGGS